MIDSMDKVVTKLLIEGIVSDFAKKLSDASKSVLADMKAGLEAGKVRSKQILSAIKDSAELAAFLLGVAKISGIEASSANTAAIKLGDNTVVNAFLALAKKAISETTEVSMDKLIDKLFNEGEGK
jgi:hypothetical protein